MTDTKKSGREGRREEEKEEKEGEKEEVSAVILATMYRKLQKDEGESRETR